MSCRYPASALTKSAHGSCSCKCHRHVLPAGAVSFWSVPDHAKRYAMSYGSSQAQVSADVATLAALLDATRCRTHPASSNQNSFDVLRRVCQLVLIKIADPELAALVGRIIAAIRMADESHALIRRHRSSKERKQHNWSLKNVNNITGHCRSQCSRSHFVLPVKEGKKKKENSYDRKKSSNQSLPLI